MVEPFKNIFRRETVQQLAEALAEAGSFDAGAFLVDAMVGLDELELKDRVRQLSRTLRAHLAAEYSDAVAQILRALPPPLSEDRTVTSGFVIWPLCQFVEDHGLDEPELSLAALYELTRRFSAEFAIRPYLLHHRELTLRHLEQWVEDPDHHVRRLVSEGTRPRLPWGIRLTPFVDDPTPILPLLEQLQDDPEEYVRRSVANNLNDISKDNAKIAVEVCRRWMLNSNAPRRKLIRHALRTLVKAGDPKALEVLGFAPPRVQILAFDGPDTARIGDAAQLSARIKSTSNEDQRLIVDYAMLSPSAKGGFNRRIFKWSTRTIAAGGTIEISHKHPFKPVTTRPTRPGEHRFELQVNGQKLAEHRMDLQEPADA